MTPTLTAGGVTIPRLGIGTFALHDGRATRVVADGLTAGYRHVDTAEMYQNERAVGEGIRASGLPRSEVFVTTKVWHDHLGDALMQAAAEASLERLGLDHVDLYLIHWPSPAVAVPDAVRSLLRVRERGLARSVGVSNFPAAMLREAVAVASEAGVSLAVNQVEYHPYLDQSAVLATLREHGMGLTAYSPLARGNVARDPTIGAIAGRHGASPAVVVLAWLLSQDGVIAIPKSASPERLRDNLAACEVALSAEEIAAINALRSPRGRLISPDFAPAWD